MSAENVFYYEAFWELSSDRQIGMAIGEIPFSSIDRYARRYGIHAVDRFDEFRRVMRAMDVAYRSLISKPREDGETVSAKDVKGVRNLFRRMGDRFKKSQGVEG